MSHIVEYIGREGVRTTPLNVRIQQGPKPGDVIEYPEGAPYPYAGHAHGRIESVGGRLEGPGRAHICCSGGSVFLYESGNVAISGGPFECVPLDRLEWTGKTMAVDFWNWGDHYAGAGQGVCYKIYRPVYRLKLGGDHE